jgi:drug/metabolite transporter (DMT)-like permease
MSEAPAPDKGKGAVGPLIGLASATSFGLMTVLARLAYDGGTEPITVTAIRSVVGFLAVVAVIPVFRQNIAVPRQAVPTLIAITLCRFAASISIMTAIYFIPVSLAVLLLYTHPLMVAGASSVINRIPLGRARCAAFAIAFSALPWPSVRLSTASTGAVSSWRYLPPSTSPPCSLSPPKRYARPTS